MRVAQLRQELEECEGVIVSLKCALNENVWHKENETDILEAFTVSESIVDDLFSRIWNDINCKFKSIEDMNVQSVETTKKRKLSEVEDVEENENTGVEGKREKLELKMVLNEQESPTRNKPPKQAEKKVFESKFR